MTAQMVEYSQQEAPKLTRRQKQFWRRLGIAALVALALHVLFFYLAPLMRLPQVPPKPTEVIQISPEEIARLKERLKNQQLAPLMEQELREEYRTKEAPKNARMMGKFNQTVPEETVAGAQRDAPQIAQGGGSGGPASRQRAAQRSREQTQPREQLTLSKLGLGYKLPKPMTKEEQQASAQGRPGPPQPFRPMGRDDPRLKKGGDNLLNAVESEYYSFFIRFEEPIVRNWYFNLRQNDSALRQQMAQRGFGVGSEVPCTIEFTIDRSGKFISIEVVESSGVPVLDSATRAAVAKLGALPNPPAGLFENGNTFSYRLRFMVHVTGALVSDPALSWY